MVVLLAKYRVFPGKGKVVEGILKDMAAQVREHEPGCRTYQVNRSVENPDLLLLYEQYDDMAALEAHRATPHFRKFIEGIVVPLLEGRERELYEVAVE